MPKARRVLDFAQAQEKARTWFFERNDHGKQASMLVVVAATL